MTAGSERVTRQMMWAFFCPVAMAVLVADLLTKWLAFKTLKNAPIAVVPGLLNLKCAPLNTGAVWSIGQGLGPLFIIFTIIAVAGIVWVVRVYGRSSRTLTFGLALIMGGALGNLWDRLLHGGVRDFIDAYLGKYHWPTFNVADMGICVGAGLIMLYSFKTQGPAKKSKAESVK